MSTPSHPATTIILGAGIIGLSTAYYLSSSSSHQPIHLIDPAPHLFTSASGFAGGLLSRSWFPETMLSLAELSFDEHVKLAEEQDRGGRKKGEKWGFRRTRGGSWVEDEEEDGKKERPEDWLMSGRSRSEAAKGEAETGPAPEWLKRATGRDIRMISRGEDMAIVDPLKLCQHLLRECETRGVKVHTSTHATSIQGQILHLRHATGKESTLPFTNLVLAAGAWTPSLYRTLFPSSPLHLPITAVAGHSLVLRSPSWALPTESIPDTGAIFCTDPTGYFPEMFLRADGTIWLGGVNSSSLPLPKADSGKAVPLRGDIEKLMKSAEALYGMRFEGKEVEVLREGLCFRPVTGKGVPIIGEVGGNEVGGGARVFVAAGHGPWGISLSLGTGKVVSKMVRGEALSADVVDLGLQGEMEGGIKAKL